MGGQEVFRRLRQTCPDLPVIIMSGYTEEAVAAQFSESGADLNYDSAIARHHSLKRGQRSVHNA